MNGEFSQTTCDVVDDIGQMVKLQDEWDALHQNCTRPSIYNTFDFIYCSTKSFQSKGVKLLLISVRISGVLIGVFPLQSFAYRVMMIPLRTLEYNSLDETDKPYPIIKNGHYDLAWTGLFNFLKQEYLEWDVLHLIEVPAGGDDTSRIQGFSQAFGLIYRQNGDKSGPIISFDGEWESFWSSHPKMRKKIRKMEKDFAETIKFEVIENDWERGLATYIDLESRSWKSGKVGVSKNDQSKAFYREFFERLSRKNKLVFGVLSVDGLAVSAEIAYIEGDTVYFSHGCYDQGFNKYSPGMVSTSYFLQHFFSGDYRVGDFLCGYAGYLNAWSESIVYTHRVDVYRPTIRVRLMFTIRILNKLLVSPARSVLRKVFKRNSDD